LSANGFAPARSAAVCPFRVDQYRSSETRF
jgi:hypothetical protein